MKKAQREVYLALIQEVGSSLCTFCKYSRWEGSPCTDDCYAECLHPLDKRYEKFLEDERISMGGDCWGFRPQTSLANIADIVGIILAKGLEDWSWVMEKDGTIKVYGRSKVLV